ncbi:MAG: glutamylcysteine synthetase [Ruminococcus sp.]
MEYNKDMVRKLLYDKYIKPTTENKDLYIGIEIEMPVVNLNREPVDKSLMLRLIKDFAEKFGFTPTGYDDNKDIYAVVNSVNGDIFTFDCSYNNLEISFGKVQDLNEVWERFTEYIEFSNDYLMPYNTLLTGFGENPYRQYNNNIPIPNGRYRMLFHYLNSYKEHQPEKQFHSYPEFGTYSSASQVQIDVKEENLAHTINVFNSIEPLKALLFSNSVLNDENENFICARDMLWEHSMQGYNKHNTGMYNVEFKDSEDIVDYLSTTSIYCTERDGKYINFTPIMITEYFEKDIVEGEYFQDGEYHKITFIPEKSDIEYLRTFKFTDLTFRGTVEHRSCCCQPFRDTMCVSAFHLGITNKIDKVMELINNDRTAYNRGYTPTELRKLFVKRELPPFVDKEALKKLLKALIDIAYEGLAEREKGEEKFITCLYERAEKLIPPAKEYLDLKGQGIADEELIKKFSQLI